MELRAELRGTSNILQWAGNYNVGSDICIETLVPEVKERGSLTKCELIEVAKWKVRRERNTVWRVRTICPDVVERFTRGAFLSTDGSKSIRCLRRLDGVGRAVASAILHWFHEDRYPIWDINARWAVRLNECQHQYQNDDQRWQAYVDFCRAIADQYAVDMRTLDRALFEYGKANRPSSCES